MDSFWMHADTCITGMEIKHTGKEKKKSKKNEALKWEEFCKKICDKLLGIQGEGSYSEEDTKEKKRGRLKIMLLSCLVPCSILLFTILVKSPNC